MALPDLVEIQPPASPVAASITVPGSKSITNRALILAALGNGKTALKGALWSEDTEVMVECLRALGFQVEVQPDPGESGNRHIAVQGMGGIIPNAGSQERPLELFVGNAGTAARFLAPLVCLGDGFFRLHGIPRMHERPQAGLFQALHELGYEVEANGGRLPAIIRGTGPRRGTCSVSIRESSQFASGLLLSARVGGWDVQVRDENSEESSYISMTRHLLDVFPEQGGLFTVEADASGGSYFWAADRLLNLTRTPGFVTAWPKSGWQIDARFPEIIWSFPQEISRARDLGDSIMTAIILAPFQARPVRFTDLGRLRSQECERVMALRTELTRCGTRVTESGDTLLIEPSRLHGAEIETYNDHRMAMCFAVVGLAVPGIRLRQPACVRKTFPTFFQKLTAAAPSGLGARVLDAQGNVLAPDDLIAT